MSDDDFNSKAPEEMKPTPKRGVSKRKSELADSATKKKSKSDASSGRSRSSLSSQLQIDMIGNQLVDDVLKSPTRLTRRSSAKASSLAAQSPPVTKATSTKNQKTSAAQSPLPPISQIAPLTTSIPAPAPAPAPVFVVTPTQPSVSQPVTPLESTKSCTFATTGKSFVKQEWYDCNTCGLAGNDGDAEQKGVCAGCAARCHSGHDVAPHTPFFKNAYCDCGVQGPTKCFALPPKEQSTTAIASSGGESFDWAISSAKSLLLFFIILILTGLVGAISQQGVGLLSEGPSAMFQAVLKTLNPTKNNL